MAGRTVLFAHASAELYGADRMLLDSVRAVIATGGRAVVVLPGDGPLRPLLTRAGAEVRAIDIPVLRKHYLRPDRALGLAARMAVAVGRLTGVIRRIRPDAVYVNTLTIPSWLVAARLCRVPCLVHVHEAERTGRLVGVVLTAPLLLARIVVVNSAAAAHILAHHVPALAGRTRLVHNGVAGPAGPVRALPPDRPGRPDRLGGPGGPGGSGSPGRPCRLLVVGRLSPRKGTDVAINAALRLRDAGRDVRLDLVGSTFDGYEWYERELRRLADAPGLAGHVHFHGFQPDTGPFLDAADIVLVPSRVEPFGNVAVEALLAGRPLVASATQGLLEIVAAERTGLLVPPDDPVALATAVGRLLDDWPLATRLAAAGHADAADRFSTEQYHARISRLVDGLIDTPPTPRW
ncbi:glycosyl transferase family 1 [Parafrankia colletiae]|uniref:Glycosyl transferase family 1 n=1 Tax=Parafrankia colletiae TaxID=573497 RepID=A0A1S1Q6D9_9ACTN|nr:glycosyltransferase [Parafrankia colletiae]MCK9899962.1 glycosyltransferase [Frankia sp. Cpl3]OHV28682.1 glycosyl transferase family 1 [Parafrankia colletiae]